MKITTTGKSINVKPDSSPREQASVWNMMRGMAGEDPLPTCEECGGFTSDDGGPLKGKCNCNAGGGDHE